MSDFDTIQSITDNIKTVVRGQGLDLKSGNIGGSVELNTKKTTGILMHTDTEYENTHGQRSSSAEGLFTIVIFTGTQDNRNYDLKERELNEWSYKLRDSLTVDALNIGNLVTTKYVSKVTTVDTPIEQPDVEGGANVLQLTFEFQVRYREI